MYGHFKQKTSKISHKKTWTWLRKGSLNRECAKQHHKDYVKAKIDKAPQNNKCKLYGDRDEMINHIISEWSKSAQWV